MRKSVLVLGADAGLGAGVYTRLRQSYDVYTYQENPANPNEEDSTWFMGSLEEPHESVTLVSKLMEKLGDKKLDGMVVVSRYGMRLYDGVMAWDLMRAAAVNVFEPLVMLKYLLKYDVMHWTGRAVFMYDPPTSRTTSFPLCVVGAGMEEMVREFSKNYPATFKTGFVRVSWKAKERPDLPRYVGEIVEEMLGADKMAVRVEV